MSTNDFICGHMTSVTKIKYIKINPGKMFTGNFAKNC